ncbi:lysophospholipid acyltransferase family protein [Noviherbaspirillum sp.]|uniref:lysophospholipid acyltransferase family protein n=1 Tax=Noviherbaspirillum sp. TaxID=1926288 RepID=UPI002FE3EF99
MNEIPTPQKPSRWTGASLSRKRTPVQRVGAWLYGIYTWIIFIVLVLSFAVIAFVAGRPDRSRRLAHRFARWMFALTGISISAKGLDRLPAGPHVLLSNHTSFLDAIVLTALLPPSPGYTFTTRQEFRLQRVLCPLLRSVRTVVLKPTGDSHHAGNVEIMRSVLERGENLMIFPEGEFGPEPGLRSLHSGAFVTAAQAGVPIVVAGLRGARAILPSGSWLPRRGSIVFEIGPTLMPDSQSAEDIHALLAAARKAMIALAGEGARLHDVRTAPVP